MKLIKCYIENFGKLQNFTYEFKDGLNTIIEDNGFGKTTFASFIKSMFYGLDATKSEKSDRKRYKPWQGGAFGGNIEFEIDGKKYRIERFFGSKATDDTFKLYDLNSNLESKDYTANIGEEIFKINKTGYERSTYIPQGQIQIEMEDSINAKLGNVLESDNDVNSSDEAIKKLADTMKIYVKTGNKGILNEKKDRLAELQRSIENSKFDTINLENKQNKLNEIKENIKQLSSDLKEKQQLLSKKIELGRRQAKLETYGNIISKINDEEAKLNKLLHFFKMGVPEDEKIQDATLKANELEKIKIELRSIYMSQDEKSTFESLENKFSGRNVTEEDINTRILYCSKIKELQNKMQEEKNKKENIERNIFEIQEQNKNKTKLSKVLIGCSVIIFIIGITLIILGILVGFAPLIIGILGIILWISQKRNGELLEQFEGLNIKFKDLEKDTIGLEKDIENMRKSIDDFVDIFDEEPAYDDKIMILTNLKIALNTYKTLENKYKNAESRRQSLVAKEAALDGELQSFFKKYFGNTENSYLEKIQMIKYNKNELKTITDELEKTKKQKEDFENVNNIEELQQAEIMVDCSENQLNDEIKNLTLTIDKLNDEKNQIKNQIEVIANKIDENEYLETDYENLKEEISNEEKRYDILSKTKGLLENAKINFSSNYLNDMISGFKEYIDFIEDKDLKANIDINLDVKLDVNGAQKEVKYFSAGYKDLIYICMRFSLIKALFKEEVPFVILDDPFVNLDDSKTKKAIKLLEQLSQEYQIIYFICNQSRM